MTDNTPTTIPRMLTEKDISALTGIPVGTIQNWRYKGKGPKFVKLGPSHSDGVRYKEEDFLEWRRNLPVTSPVSRGEDQRETA